MALSRLFFLLPLFIAVVQSGALAQVIQQQQQPPVAGPPGSAQTRTVEGSVVDKKDQAVPHATVLLQDTKTLQVRSYIADGEGRFRFYGLSTEVNYDLFGESNGMISKLKTVSVFDSHRVVKLKLKLTQTKKPQ